MPGKTAAPHEIPYALESDEPPSLEAASKPQAEQVHKRLNEIDPKQIVGGSAGKLLIAKSTGAGAYAAMKGDATLAEDGTLTIGNDAITAAKIAENAVGSSEIAANAVGASEIASGAVNSSKIEDGSIALADLAAAAKPFAWYAPKIIPTEQSRENAAFGVLGTADEIKEVLLPENGLLIVGYMAKVKSSAAAAGRVAIFLNSNQLKGAVGAGGITTIAEQQASTVGTNEFAQISTAPVGLRASSGAVTEADVTTGQTISAALEANIGGLCAIFAAAGTYAVSVRYKATSGNVTAKERKLWVAVLGV